MTTAPAGAERPSPSRLLAAEIRAASARQGITAKALGLRMGVSHTWVHRRTSIGSNVEITFEELDRIAEALGGDVTSQGLMRAAGLLPRLDSNQQPSD